MKSVYLAGPITGLTFDGAQDWRANAQVNLPGIEARSPLRGKEYLRAIGKISGTGEEYAHLSCISSPRGVMTRDFFDATGCDAVLVNLLGAKAVSIGTVMEIAWAYQARRPVICVMEESGNPHEHMMLAEALGYRVTTLEEALHIVKLLLGA